MFGDSGMIQFWILATLNDHLKHICRDSNPQLFGQQRWSFANRRHSNTPVCVCHMVSCQLYTRGLWQMDHGGLNLSRCVYNFNFNQFKDVLTQNKSDYEDADTCMCSNLSETWKFLSAELIRARFYWENTCKDLKSILKRTHILKMSFYLWNQWRSSLLTSTLMKNAGSGCVCTCAAVQEASSVLQ